MRVTWVLSVCLSFVLIVISCKKSNSPSTPTNAVTGTYTFVNMNAQTQVTESEGGGITAVSVANYITQNNTGTIKFTVDSMAVTGVGYSVDTTAITSFYLYGTLYAADTTAFTATLPATSATQVYSVVNSDSLYFPNGGLIPAGLTSSGAGQGARFVVNGDTLKLYTSASDTSNGQMQTGTGVITLVKQ
jgi:hypothetical protein